VESANFSDLHRSQNGQFPTFILMGGIREHRRLKLQADHMLVIAWSFISTHKGLLLIQEDCLAYSICFGCIFFIFFTLCPKRGTTCEPILSAYLVCLSVSLSIHLAVVYRWYNVLQVLPYNDSRTADRILMKFGMEVMPLEPSPNSIKFLKSVILTWRTFRVVRLENDLSLRHYPWSSTTPDLVICENFWRFLRDIVASLPVHNFKMTGMIIIEFDTDIMPLEAAPNIKFLILYNR
jgi:hypothetical protein